MLTSAQTLVKEHKSSMFTLNSTIS